MGTYATVARPRDSRHPSPVLRTSRSGDSDVHPIHRSARGDLRSDRVPPIVEEVGRSSGRPLDPAVRDRFEPAFGVNFAQVRIHDDQRAADAAVAVDARAYTSRNHVVFGAGRFAPGTPAGDRLLAHELAHVVQQSQGPINPGISHPGDASERDADRIAADVWSATRSPGVPVRPADASWWGGGPAVQRWPGDGMKPPGDCRWATYLPLRAAVEAAKLVVNALGACTDTDTCVVLAGKIAAIAAEITARVVLVSTCFRGGDDGHRKQIQARTNMLIRCYRQFVAQDCLAKLAAQAAAAFAAAEAAAAEAATAAEIAESATATAELIEGTAAAGEAVEGGVTLLEVLEVVVLLL
jgi:hypothetical protein